MSSRSRILREVLVVLAVFAGGMALPMALATGASGFSPVAATLAAIFLIDLVIDARGRRVAPRDPVLPGGDGASGRRRRALLIDGAAFLSALYLAWRLADPGRPATKAAILVSLLPLLKLVRLDEVFDDLRDNLKVYPSSLRLVFLLFWILLGAHLIALGWILIGAVDQGLPAGLEYTTSLYWAVTALSTVGYGDITPDHDSPMQMFFAMAVMLIGVGMYGYIIGNVATLLTKLDAAKASHVEKMEEVNVFLMAHDIPRPLQDRVRDYYRYLWKTRKGSRSHALLDELPHALRVDLSLHLNRELIEKMPYFASADETFVREIVQRMRLCVFLPGDCIIRQGEAGDAMYFLSSGEVEVIVDGEVVASRGAGYFFGEAALIRDDPRNASIRAKGFCDAYRLARKDFDDMRSRYPGFDRHVNEALRRREDRGPG